jgi:ubiquinone/menaquinone biosynthesis C-methylase UbiE
VTTEPQRYLSPIQEITLDALPKDGLILDIGGGGEGLVSRIGGERVCAVDYRMNEILEAKIYDPPASWFLSNAIHLPFRQDSFDIATLWFSLGYMREWSTKEHVLAQVLNVLRPGGVLSVLASRIDCREERFIFNALFTLPNGIVSRVGYGVQGSQGQTLDRLCSLIRRVGFEDLQIQDHDWWFSIQAYRRV